MHGCLSRPDSWREPSRRSVDMFFPFSAECFTHCLTPMKPDLYRISEPQEKHSLSQGAIPVYNGENLS